MSSVAFNAAGRGGSQSSPGDGLRLELAGASALQRAAGDGSAQAPSDVSLTSAKLISLTGYANTPRRFGQGAMERRTFGEAHRQRKGCTSSNAWLWDSRGALGGRRLPKRAVVVDAAESQHRSRRDVRYASPNSFAENMITKTLETLSSFMRLVLPVHRPRLLLGHRPKWFELGFSRVKYR